MQAEERKESVSGRRVSQSVMATDVWGSHANPEPFLIRTDHAHLLVVTVSELYLGDLGCIPPLMTMTSNLDRDEIKVLIRHGS